MAKSNERPLSEKQGRGANGRKSGDLISLSGRGDEIQIDFGYVDLFRHVDPDGYMWTSDGHREASATVSFDSPYDRIPYVILNVVSLDCSKSHNLRFDLSAQNVTRQGFEIVFATWDDTKIASCSVSWMSIANSSSAALRQMVSRKRAE